MNAQFPRHFHRYATALLLGVLAVPWGASAATIRVDSATGFDVGGCGSDGSPCASVQYAVNGASSGDTILVAAGTYTYDVGLDPCPSDHTGVVCIQPVTFMSLTIKGGYAGGDWTTPTPDTNVTIIDGQDAYRGVLVNGTNDGAALVMEGFTVRNGLGLSRPGLDDNGFGGGVSVVLADLTLRNMVIEDNEARGADVDPGKGGAGAGGGVAIRSSNGSPRATLVLENVTFDNNRAVGGTGEEAGGFGEGGAMFLNYTDASGSDIVVTNNQALAGSSTGDGITGGKKADAQGGGIAFKEASDSTFQRVTATGNLAQGGDAASSGGSAGGAFGGGLYGERADSYSIIDGVVRDNVAHGGNADTAGMGFGGGVYALDSEVSLNRLQIINNEASGGDGTTKKGSGGGGGLYFADNDGVSGGRMITMLNVVVAGNSAALGSGGGTTSGGGGGLFVNGAQSDASHCTFADNGLSDSPPMQGKAIVLITRTPATPVPSHMTFDYGIISDHAAYLGDAAVHVKADSSITFDTGIFSNNGTDTAGVGTYNGLGSMSSEASVVYVAGGSPDFDYRLQESSPAVDTASGSTETLDFEGDVRDGSPDIGADEHTESLDLIFADGFESGDTSAW